jgi:hypothetical protein
MTSGVEGGPDFLVGRQSGKLASRTVLSSRLCLQQSGDYSRPQSTHNWMNE